MLTTFIFQLYKNNYSKPILFLLLLILLFPKISYPFQDFEDGINPFAEDEVFATQSEESFFKLEEEVVYSASKQAQKVSEAPAAVSIITSDNIQKVAPIIISEYMRNVEGIEFTMAHHSDQLVGVRGVNGSLSNQLLTLIDNRPIYIDLYGFTAWGGLPIVLEEIDRVEIIRGPGAVMYGANAFQGVINILTKKNFEKMHNEINVKGGEIGTLSTSVIHSNNLGKFNYKVSAGYDRLGKFEDTYLLSSIDGNTYDIINTNIKGDFRCLYNLDENQSISFNSGFSKSKLPLESGIHTFLGDALLPYVQAVYNKDDLSIKTFYNGLFASLQTVAKSEPFDFKVNTMDVEVNKQFKLLNTHLLTGTEYRISLLKSKFFSQTPNISIVSLFAQDEYRPIESIILTGGVRWDYHTFGGNKFSPRGSIIYKLFDNHTIRLSGGTAFRNPSLVEYFMKTDIPIPHPALKNLYDLGQKIEIVGNSSLIPENISSIELGYQGKFSDIIKFKFNLFYNDMKNFIYFGTEVETQTLYPGGQPLILPKILSYSNVGHQRALGFELNTDFILTNSIKLNLVYSYQTIKDVKTNIVSLEEAPNHKATLGLYWDNIIEDLSLFTSANYSGHYQPTADFAFGKIDSYFLWNLTLNYQLNDNIRLTLAGNNILNNKHYEYPPYDIDKSYRAGELLKRRITGGISVSF